MKGGRDREKIVYIGRKRYILKIEREKIVYREKEIYTVDRNRENCCCT